MATITAGNVSIMFGRRQVTVQRFFVRVDPSKSPQSAGGIVEVGFVVLPWLCGSVVKGFLAWESLPHRCAVGHPGSHPINEHGARFLGGPRVWFRTGLRFRLRGGDFKPSSAYQLPPSRAGSRTLSPCQSGMLLPVLVGFCLLVEVGMAWVPPATV